MTKLLVSTDIGSDPDDALALLAMINSGLDPEVIYTVNGKVEMRSYIAKHLVDLARKNIDVACADSQPLPGGRTYSFLEEYYVDLSFVDDKQSRGASNLIYKSLEEVGIIKNGFDDLVRRLSADKYVIFSLAPMTIIARALEEHPKVQQNIERIYAMGCRFPEEDLEHNNFHDPAAASIVYSSEIPITVIPGNLCSQLRMPAVMLGDIGSKAGYYVKRMTMGHLAAITAQQFTEHSIRGESLDSILTHIMKVPEKFTVNLNAREHAACNPKEYMKQMQCLIEHIRDVRHTYPIREVIAKKLELLHPSSLSVADVYVPYCYLHPERVKTEKGAVQIGTGGRSKLQRGHKHDIVTNIDKDHFLTFLEQRIR